MSDADMSIPAREISSHEKIGYVDAGDGRKDPVFAIDLKGGLSMVVRSRPGGKIDVLGASPHPAVSEHLARKKEPKLTITRLAKSEYALSAVLPIAQKWEYFTDALRARQRG